jgi:hypothetical protein
MPVDEAYPAAGHHVCSDVGFCSTGSQSSALGLRGAGGQTGRIKQATTEISPQLPRAYVAAVIRPRRCRAKRDRLRLRQMAKSVHITWSYRPSFGSVTKGFIIASALRPSLDARTANGRATQAHIVILRQIRRGALTSDQSHLPRGRTAVR